MERSGRRGSRRFKAAIISVLLACWSLPAGAQSNSPSPIEQYRLPNGLRVVLAPDRVTPGVSVVVRYGLGAAHAPRGYRGMTHLLEHLTFRGSRHLKPLQGMAILRELGAGFNAITGLEETQYLTQVSAPALETALWLESERMAFTLGGLDDAALDVERRIVDNEHRQRFGSHGRFLARHWLRGLYGEDHPYVDDPDLISDLTKVTLRNVQWLFQTGYRPDNATLALVGNLDVGRTRALIEKYFGPIVSPAVARASLHAPAPRLCGAHRLEVSHGGIFGHFLRVTWPLSAAADARESASRAVLVQLLQRKLHRVLVEGGADVASVRTSVERLATHELLIVDLELEEEADAAPISQSVLRVGQALSQEAPTQRELRSIGSQLLSMAVFHREDGLARAQQLAAGREPDAELAALQVLQPQDVLRVSSPLKGPSLTVHVWAAKGGDAGGRVEQEVDPCR